MKMKLTIVAALILLTGCGSDDRVAELERQVAEQEAVMMDMAKWMRDSTAEAMKLRSELDHLRREVELYQMSER
jgi:uncharacterized coiled-coil protein SlyX